MRYIKKPVRNAEMNLKAFCNCNCNGCDSDKSQCNNKCGQCGGNGIAV